MVVVLYVTVNLPLKCAPISSCELLRVTFRVIELEFLSLHIALPSEEIVGLPYLEHNAFPKLLNVCVNLFIIWFCLDLASFRKIALSLKGFSVTDASSNNVNVASTSLSFLKVTTKLLNLASMNECNAFYMDARMLPLYIRVSFL